MNIFDDLIRANQPSGLINGISLGIVANTDDPLRLQRIQVLDMTKGGQHRSDWLFRLLPFTQYSPPMPKLNELVVIGYVDGNPHKGCYLGTIHNNANKPVGADTDITMVLGDTTVSLDIAGNLRVKGANTVQVEAKGDVSVITAANVAVKAQEVTVEAATRVVTTAQTVTLSGTSTVMVQSPRIALNASSVQINGKDIVVVGGRDSRGDTIVDRGY